MDRPDCAGKAEPKVTMAIIERFDETGDIESREKFLAAWRGHAQWADSRNLLTYLGATL